MAVPEVRGAWTPPDGRAASQAAAAAASARWLPPTPHPHCALLPHLAATRAAPELAIQRDCSSEAKRMAFLTALGTQFFAATRVRLNLRRLHRAGGAAVRKLRRLAAALRQAAEAVPPAKAASAAPQLQCEAGELRGLAQRVGASAAKLVGALAAGPAAEASVAEAAAATADVAAAEAALQAALQAAQAQAAQLEAAVAALGQEAAVLEGGHVTWHVAGREFRLNMLFPSLHTLRLVCRWPAVMPAASASQLPADLLHPSRAGGAAARRAGPRGAPAGRSACGTLVAGSPA